VARTRTHPPRSSCESRRAESVQCPTSAEETGEEIRIQGEVSGVEKRICLFVSRFILFYLFSFNLSALFCFFVFACFYLSVYPFYFNVLLRARVREKDLLCLFLFLFQRFYYAYVANGEVE
jgi:hypothetical protein